MKPRPGSLTLAAICLAAAASLKLVEGVGGAWAQMPEGRLQPAAATPSDHPEVAESTPTGDRLDAELLVELRRRETRLSEREAELAGRLAELAELEDRIRAQIDSLRQAELALAATMALADQAAEADLVRLTSLFEAMRPEQAAAVVSEMAPEFAAGLIGRLQPATAAPIMAGLEPRFAYGLAAILAGRNAEVPRRASP